MLAQIIVQAFWFFLPACIANMAPNIFSRMHIFDPLRKPISVRIFGDHKTYYGFVVGVFLALVTAFFQALIFMNFSGEAGAGWLFLFPYSFSAALWLGFLQGFGALFGDLVKSFFKRRLRIASGAPFFPFDQLDFLFGGLLIGAVFYFPPLSHVLTLVFFMPLLQILINIIAYKLGLKKVWW